MIPRCDQSFGTAQARMLDSVLPAIGLTGRREPFWHAIVDRCRVQWWKSPISSWRWRSLSPPTVFEGAIRQWVRQRVALGADLRQREQEVIDLCRFCRLGWLGDDLLDPRLAQGRAPSSALPGRFGSRLRAARRACADRAFSRGLDCSGSGRNLGTGPVTKIYAPLGCGSD
jgi:hypothetical protein